MRKLRRAAFMAVFHVGRLVLKCVDALSPRLYMRLMIPLLRYAGMSFTGVPRYISAGVKFDDFSMIRLGDRVVISDRVILLTHDYSITTALVAIGEVPDSDISVQKPITVGDNVFVGMGALVMPGAEIGSNVIIGAGTVVRGKVPSNTLWLGNPGLLLGRLLTWPRVGRRDYPLKMWCEIERWIDVMTPSDLAESCAIKHSVHMVGAFPPPVHGMAAINAAMYERLSGLDVAVQTTNIGAADLRRSFGARISRFPRVIRGLLRVCSLGARRCDSLYMSVSGGLGQAYEIAFVMLARLRGCSIVLHHHSYAYLDKRSFLTAVLTWLAGPGATHVVLTPGMGMRLRAQYPRAGRQLVVSNAALLMDGGQATSLQRPGLRSIGFLSNLSVEKGVFVFLDLCQALKDCGMPVHARLAGPFADNFVEDAVRRRLRTLENVEYVGPQYGDQKESFFSSIDAFLFPTLYENEAEPLSVHEAMRHGLPTVAFARGAIGELVDGTVGLAVDKGADFVSAARGLIALWVEKPGEFAAASEAARRKFEATRLHSTSAVKELERLLVEGRKVA